MWQLYLTKWQLNKVMLEFSKIKLLLSYFYKNTGNKAIFADDIKKLIHEFQKDDFELQIKIKKTLFNDGSLKLSTIQSNRWNVILLKSKFDTNKYFDKTVLMGNKSILNSYLTLRFVSEIWSEYDILLGVGLSNKSNYFDINAERYCLSIGTKKQYRNETFFWNKPSKLNLRPIKLKNFSIFPNDIMKIEKNNEKLSWIINDKVFYSIKHGLDENIILYHYLCIEIVIKKLANNKFYNKSIIEYIIEDWDLNK